MTSYAYARGQQQSTLAGSVILTVVSFLALALVVAGLVYATGTGARHKIALAAAGCEPNLSPDPASVPCTTVWDLERQYTKMTTPAIQQLNADVADYTVNERRDLAAAESALMAEVTTAKAFDKSLAQFPFPPVVAPEAKTLIQAIQARIELTDEQVQAHSLTQLRSFNDRVKAAGTAIQSDMELVHKALYTRPTANQEP